MNEEVKLEVLTTPLPSLDIRVSDDQIVIVCSRRIHAKEWREVLKRLRLGKVTLIMRTRTNTISRAKRIIYRIGINNYLRKVK